MRHEKFPPIPDCTRDGGIRAEVILLCEVRQGARPWAMARLDDISPTGFRIAWFPGCIESQPVRIRMPGLQVLSANVRWRKGNAVGCAFAEPLHVAVFEHIVRQAQGRGAAC